MKSARANDQALAGTDMATTTTFPADGGRFQTIVRKLPAMRVDS